MKGHGVMITPCTSDWEDGNPHPPHPRPGQSVSGGERGETSWSLISDLIHLAPDWPRAVSASRDTPEMTGTVEQGTLARLYQAAKHRAFFFEGFLVH